MLWSRTIAHLGLLPTALCWGVVAPSLGLLNRSLAADAPAPAAKPTTVTETCVSEACHQGVLGFKFMHGPTAQHKCQACHRYDEARDHRFKLATPKEQLCFQCHTFTTRNNVHEPVRQGRCSECHNPHGSEFRAMLVADPTHGLCLNCHKQDFTKKRFVHGPVGSGACVLCHEPHSSWHPKLLTEDPKGLCLNCHRELVAQGEQGRHVHAPVKDGNCTGCHDVHASDFKYQLRHAPAELCLSCHKEVAQTLATSKVVHGAMDDPAACTACHQPHFSALPKLERSAQPQSCLTCHDKPLTAGGGAKLADMGALLRENPQHHGPIREGACTACHGPHAGPNFRLLTDAYPPDFYATFEPEQYALCFRCHISDLATQQEGVGMTGFRRGAENLHWVHVSRGKKGRTCRACHEVHASRRPFHIRETVPFGDKGWMLEVNYQKTATGGTCSPGCHVPRSYDWFTPAIPTATPAPAAPEAH